MSSGSQALDRLFPGLLDELVATGANACDEGDLSAVSMQMGGHEFNRSGSFADPAALTLHVASRPFLEGHVRQRVRCIGNVEVLDGHDVIQPIAEDPHRITGVRVAHRDSGDERILPANLVIDATGRGSRTPAFLEALGLRPPAGASLQDDAVELFQPAAADPAGHDPGEGHICFSGEQPVGLWSPTGLRKRDLDHGRG